MMEEESAPKTLKTPFYSKHLENNAKIVNFHGWLMPVEYRGQGILAEAKAVRTSCGLFDVSHMGQIRIKGQKRLEFLQQLVTNDISFLKPGMMQYNLFCNEEGGIIDDLMVYFLKDSLYCVINASNIDTDYQWLVEHNNLGVEIIDESFATCLLALQGPESIKVMRKICGEDIVSLKYMEAKDIEIEGVNCLISRSGYTGEDGFEIYFPRQYSEKIWEMFILAGKGHSLVLCGLGARDILRLEAGYTLYGNDIDLTTGPFEAGLGWAVKMDKEFIGRKALAKKKEKGLKRRRIGFIMVDKAFARQHYPFYSQDGKLIGEATSGAYSPNLDKFIGMGYLPLNEAAVGSSFNVKIRDKFYSAQVAKMPFLKLRVKKEG